MGLLVVDGLDAAFKGVGRAGEGTVADLQFDHILALGTQLARHGEDIERGFNGKALGESGERGLSHWISIF